MSQRTNTADPVTVLQDGGFNNEHFASEICPQTEKKSNYSSLYQMDKVSVPFEHEANMNNQSIITMDVRNNIDCGIEETVKKVNKSTLDHGIVEE